MPQHPILRLGPGLHSRGMRSVGHAVVGTAGALPAHHQDASAPGEGWEVSQKLESLKPCEIPHYGYKHRRISGLRLVFPCLFTASWPNRHIVQPQVKLQRSMMPKLRVSAKLLSFGSQRLDLAKLTQQ